MIHSPIDNKPGFMQDPYYPYASAYEAYEEEFFPQEPFFKKDYFGMEKAFNSHSMLEEDQFQEDFQTPDGLNGFGNVMDKQEIFDYLRELKEQLNLCGQEKRFSLRQDLFVSSVNALTHPQTDVVLIHIGRQCVQQCVDSAIADLDVDFLNIGIIFLLQIHEPRNSAASTDPTASAADRKIQDFLRRHTERTASFMRTFAGRPPAPSLEQDVLSLGLEFRRTFKDLVFRTRFEFLRNLRDATTTKDIKKRAKVSPEVAKQNAALYQDRALTCCPGDYADPPKTPYFQPLGGFWMKPSVFPQKQF